MSKRRPPKVGSDLWIRKFSACEKKNAYLTQDIARSVAINQSKKTGHQIKHYKCPFSEHWHIGHSSSQSLPGPKIYCGKCDRKIPQMKWDAHYRLCSKGIVV